MNRILSPSAKAYIAGLAFAAVAHASGQGLAYCNITAVRTKQLSNGVEVTIQADGAMQVSYDFAEFFNAEAIRLSQWENFAKPTTVLPFLIRNARSKVGSVVDIAVYPASHIEMTTPPGAAEGIGLDVRMTLYTECIPISVRTQMDSWEFWLQDPSKPAVRLQGTPDQRGLTIIITSNQRSVPPAQHRVAPPGAPTRIRVTPEGERMSIAALNADLREVVRSIAEETGKPVVADASLERIVSFSLPGVTLHEALEALATSYGLSIDESGLVAQVSDARIGRVESLGANQVDQIRLNHISAFAARNSLPEFLLRFVRVNPQANSITVSGPAALLKKVRADLEKIDAPMRQVEIEGTLVEFGSADDLESALDVDAGALNSRFRLSTRSGDLRYEYVGTPKASFDARLRALASSGKAVIRARTVAVALSGRTAELFVGSQKLVKVDYYDVFAGSYLARILNIDVGAKIRVTPTIGESGWILAQVEPEVTSIVEQEARTGLPTVASRSAKTTIQLKDGDCLMVGGLDLGQLQDSRGRTPVGSSLALLGVPLDARQKSRARTELAFFVRARIVQSPSSTPSGVESVNEHDR